MDEQEKEDWRQQCLKFARGVMNDRIKRADEGSAEAVNAALMCEMLEPLMRFLEGRAIVENYECEEDFVVAFQEILLGVQMTAADLVTLTVAILTQGRDYPDGVAHEISEKMQEITYKMMIHHRDASRELANMPMN